MALCKLRIPKIALQAVIMAVILIALVAACNGGWPQQAAQPAQTAGGEGPITVYFTDPYDRSAPARRGGADEALAAAIDQATESIEVAIYNLSIESVGEALLRAHRRGVKVRLVMESDALGGRMPQRLIDAGIPLLGDRRQGAMHNKFTVIDGREVWIGSLNYTATGFYADHNNLARIVDERMAQNYITEFDEMFEEDQFGQGSPANTPYPQLSIGEARLEVYFSPDDGVLKRLLAFSGSAAESIDFLAYSFTSDPLAEAMLERHKAGVKVRGVFDASQVETNIGSDYGLLREAGLDVRLDGAPGQMHHKVMVIDGRAVAFGSYNFSNNAERVNDESLVIIDHPETARLFLEEFERIYARSQPGK